mmetsp:Transcript_95514/g.296893  ORF Transcript_95514/g.296893 Transcript_95514/m.296893 type:complete len:218 (-) Transcript_95514:44-697(-)
MHVLLLAEPPGAAQGLPAAGGHASLALGRRALARGLVRVGPVPLGLLGAVPRAELVDDGPALQLPRERGVLRLERLDASVQGLLLVRRVLGSLGSQQGLAFALGVLRRWPAKECGGRTRRRRRCRVHSCMHLPEPGRLLLVGCLLREPLLELAPCGHEVVALLLQVFAAPTLLGELPLEALALALLRIPRGRGLGKLELQRCPGGHGLRQGAVPVAR